MIVDPYIVAVPSGDGIGKEAILEWAERLAVWNTDFPKDRGMYVFSSMVLDQLCKADLFPNVWTLRKLFDDFGIDCFDAHDIGASCSSNLGSMQFLEDEFASIELLDDVHLYDVEEISPENIQLRLPPTVAFAFSQALLQFGCVLNVSGSSARDYWLATSLDRDSSDWQELVMKASHLENDELVTIESRLPLVRDPDYVNVTRNAADYYSQNLQDALDIVVSKMRVRCLLVRSPSEFPKYVFGSRFSESIGDLMRIHQREIRDSAVEVIFEAMFHVLTGEWPYNGPLHHKLRIGVGGGDDQRVRRHPEGGVDRAIRIRAVCRLTDGNEHHLHVHYWHRADGVMEFSNVTFEHDDDTIY